jgi:hypothetical protein
MPVSRRESGLQKLFPNSRALAAPTTLTTDTVPNGAGRVLEPPNLMPLNCEAAPGGTHPRHSAPGSRFEDVGHLGEPAAEDLPPRLVVVPPLRGRPSAFMPHSHGLGSPPERSRRGARLGRASPVAEPEPAGVGGVGLLLRRHDGAALPVVVEHVKAGGPAALSGRIRPQDRLLAVDEREVAPLSTGAIAALIAGPAGSPVRLTLLRGGGGPAADGGGGLLPSLAALLGSPPAAAPPPYPAPGALAGGPFVVQLVRAVVDDAGNDAPGVLGI